MNNNWHSFYKCPKCGFEGWQPQPSDSGMPILETFCLECDEKIILETI